MKEVNIIVMGKTGSGKSTLINSVFNEDVAPTGTGRAVTRVNQIYSKTIRLPVGKKRSDGTNNTIYYRV